MLGLLRKKLGQSSLFAFNVVNRDRWVAIQAAKLSPGSKILDIGAGSCPYRQCFVHCDYLAQDFTGLQGDQLRHGGYGKIDYICDATAIPAPDASFDAILSTEMLEHVADPLAVIAECARLLKPGGILFLTAPLGSGIHQEPHHYFGGFTPYWYRTFLAQAGFADITVEANAGSFMFFSQEAIRFLLTTVPFRKLPFLASLCWLPFWLLLLPFLGLIVPMSCSLLDRYDADKRFTVGYHVTARRSAKRVS